MVLFLIYVVIAFTFRSYSQPFMLILLIPFSFIAVAWGHWLHNFPINILSALGIIALIGIMVNDGLVLIGKFNSYLKEGMKFDQALYEAGRSRFRAIFLTSLTTVAGLMPLLLEKSRQAQFLKPMAISISYGIMIATFLTLIFTPSMLAVRVWVTTYAEWASMLAAKLSMGRTSRAARDWALSKAAKRVRTPEIIWTPELMPVAEPAPEEVPEEPTQEAANQPEPAKAEAEKPAGKKPPLRAAE